MAQNFLEGSTNKALISMSVPISIGMLSTFLFQVIDTYFVGQLGAAQLAALSFASTVYFLLVGLFIGLAIGVATIIASAFGSGKVNEMRRTASIALGLTFIISSSTSAIGIGTIEPLFSFLGADADILPLINEYMWLLYAGMPMLMIGIVGGSVLRAIGVVKPPEIVMGIGGIINLIFDYLLIFGIGPFPEMGIAGAALATVLSWCFIIIAMLIMMVQHQTLTADIFDWQSVTAIISNINRLGLPAIVTQLVTPAMLMYVTYLLGKETAEAVAAYGIAGRLETLLLIGILGVSTAATPFIAQNLGAGKHMRIDEAIAFGGKASVFLGALLYLFLLLSIEPIAALFSDNNEVVGTTVFYFNVVGASYIFYGLYLITASIFNGLKLPVNSLRIMLVKSFVFTVPLTLLGSFWGVKEIFIGLSISNVLGGIYAAFEMQRQLRKVKSPLARASALQDYRNDLQALKNFVTSKFK